MFRKLLDQGRLATTSACCCAAPSVKTCSAARCCAKPGSITAHTTSPARCMSCRRKRAAVTPFFNNYRPQFYFRTTDVTGSISPPEGTEDGHAGRQHLHDRQADRPIAMEEGLRFAIREGGRTVGAGVVAKLSVIFTWVRRMVCRTDSSLGNNMQNQKIRIRLKAFDYG